MTKEETFAMIKPYAFRNNHVGPILAIINNAGFRIRCLKSTKLTKDQAEEFYAVHKSKEFYENLVSFMSSGPIIAMILEKENAIADFRALIGKTNPKEAEEGTIRKLFAESVQKNAIHGSDSPENAKKECDFFFSYKERY